MSESVEKSWYTKYRPATISEYSGKHIQDLVHKRFKTRSAMPHVIMIQGSRGCGKTTFCRIMSKYYLCENPQPDGTPCEECTMCTSINDILIDGNSSEAECPGVTELDATIMNGKEAIQNVLDDAIQPPLYSDYKVLIIDECHMISNAGQNSMLKIIEDIPKHLVVFFATTDPQKVLGTIKSRCQLHIEVRKQTVSDMADRLMVISQKEGLRVSREALEAIAKKADRVPRECINLLEDIAKTYDGDVTIDNVRAKVGGIASEKYIEYFKAANSSLGEVVEFVRSLKDSDVKYSDFINGIIGFVMDSLYIKHGIALEEYPLEYTKAIKELFEMYDSNDFDMLMQIIENLSSQTYNIDNDNKVEMLITITAMRISKVTLLANGLADEQHESIVENKRSLYEHSQMLKRQKEIVSERLKIDLDMEELKDGFEDLSVIKGTNALLDGLNIPEVDIVVPEDTEENVIDNEEDTADDFFSDM